MEGAPIFLDERTRDTHSLVGARANDCAIPPIRKLRGWIDGHGASWKDERTGNRGTCRGLQSPVHMRCVES